MATQKDGSMKLKTREQVRAEFAYRGESVSAWAKQHGYSVNLVLEIINDDARNPKRKCVRGESHNIAVDLGIKNGQVFRAPTAVSRFGFGGAAA